MTKKRSPSGVAVDSSGGPVVDPTANVLDLVDGSVKRLDDLRTAENKATRRMVYSESAHLHEVVGLRAEIATIRAKHSEELRVAEAHRIDAILINVSDTAEITNAAAETRATTLATQVTSSADAMRNQVAAAAQASNDNLDRRFGPIQASIEEIRKFQFETQGGKADAQQKSTSWGLWVGIAIAVFSAFVAFNGMLLGVVGVAVTIFLTRS